MKNVLIADPLRILFVSRRKELHLGQKILAHQAGLSERTIQDLESGRKNLFRESTVIALCRTLNLDYNDLFPNGQEQKNGSRDVSACQEAPASTTVSYPVDYQILSGKLKRKVISSPIIRSILITLVLIILIMALFWMFRGCALYDRKDWVLPEHKGLFVVERPDAVPGEPGVDKRAGQYLINYINMKQLLQPNEVVTVSFKWSWKYSPGGRPVVYLSAFTQWDPDKEIPIFHGILHGVGSDSCQFEFIGPSKPGIYCIRFFWASAYSPLKSFYGSPPEGMMESPSSAPCCEMKIEVLPNR